MAGILGIEREEVNQACMLPKYGCHVNRYFKLLMAYVLESSQSSTFYQLRSVQETVLWLCHGKQCIVSVLQKL